MSTIDERDAARRLEEHSATLAARIGESIVNGELEPGEKLNEAALAQRFHVSRGPIREALRRLAERRLVVFASNAGARVAKYTLRDMLDLLQVREPLEGLAARLAAEHMTQVQKAELRVLFEAHTASIESNPTGPYLQAPEDLDFHYRIAIGSQNTMLSQLLCEDLYLVLRLCRTQHRYVTNRGRRALEEHRRVLTAIEEGDADMADFTMRRHIAAARESIQKVPPTS